MRITEIFIDIEITKGAWTNAFAESETQSHIAFQSRFLHSIDTRKCVTADDMSKIDFLDEMLILQSDFLHTQRVFKYLNACMQTYEFIRWSYRIHITSFWWLHIYLLCAIYKSILARLELHIRMITHFYNSRCRNTHEHTARQSFVYVIFDLFIVM